MDDAPAEWTAEAENTATHCSRLGHMTPLHTDTHAHAYTYLNIVAYQLATYSDKLTLATMRNFRAHPTNPTQLTK